MFVTGGDGANKTGGNYTLFIDTVVYYPRLLTTPFAADVYNDIFILTLVRVSPRTGGEGAGSSVSLVG